MTREDFLFLIGDDPGTDAAFVDSFFMKRTPPTPEELTSTGNPLLIHTSEAQNASSTLISFVPQQSGEGAPSPENIRPISGYTDLTITVNGTDLVISLGDTYYGGTLDAVTGTLTVTHAIIDMGTLDWIRNTNYDNPIFYIGISDRAYGNDIYMMCDTYQDMGRTYSGAGTFANNAPDLSCACANNSNRIYVRDDSYTTASAFQMAMDGHYIVYALAEPVTVSLTPSDVALIKGYNRLSTDGDKITITYTGYPVIIPTLEGRLMLHENLGLHDQESPDDVLPSE